MRIITVVNRQNLLDIAIQEYGSVEALFDLIADDPSVLVFEQINDETGAPANTSMGIMSNLFGGQKIAIKSNPIDFPTFNYFQKKQLKPVSDFLFAPNNDVVELRDHNPFDYNPLDYA